MRIPLLDGGGVQSLVDFNPTINRYSLGGQHFGTPDAIPGWTFTRASAKTALTSSGAVVSFGSGVPAITDLGILLEEARTNSFLNSAVGVTQSVTTTAASWTLSFYGTGSVTLTGGATGTLNGTGAGNRVSLTVTATAASTTLTVSGSITSVQFEAGAFVTSYIPATSAAVTRAADVASIGGLTASAGALLVSASSQNATAAINEYYAALSDGTTNNRVSMFRATGGNQMGFRDTVAGVSANPVNTTAAGVGTNKVAMSYSAGRANAAVNGVIGTPSAPASVPPYTQIAIGSGEGTGAAQINGFIQRVVLYPSALSDAQIQALTQ